mgnify:CR=1 FL=1
MIECDLDVMKNADYMIDMGPGGGDAGGTIVAAGTPEDIMASEQSITEKYLKTERGIKINIENIIKIRLLKMQRKRPEDIRLSAASDRPR